MKSQAETQSCISSQIETQNHPPEKEMHIEIAAGQ
jgi:hypothetical protein